jgi:prephenate dehydrogenase
VSARIGRLVIAGVGLIGGSLALALRRAGAVAEIVGFGRDAERLQQAVAAGVLDRGETDPERALSGADVVVLGVPLGAVAGLMRQIGPHLPATAVLTDVGSAKASVVADVETALGGLPGGFVPAHPIAGTEKSGFEAALPDLFRRRRVILTPLASTEAAAEATVCDMWEACGAEVIRMGVEHHDRMLAATSHLPHLLAYGLVDTLARWDTTEEVFQYAAGGFRDFTRIASSDPVMWRDICLANRSAVLETLEHYRRDLDHLTALVEAAEGEALEAVFRRAKTIRDRYRPVFEK